MPWFTEHWFTALQTTAILAGLLFNGVALLRDARSRRIANLFALTANHRELWERLFTQPELSRVTSPSADLARHPITPAESLFARLLLLHLNTAYQAIAQGMLTAPEGLPADLRTLFRNPVMRAAWAQLRPFQDRDFIRFVEHFI